MDSRFWGPKRGGKNADSDYVWLLALAAPRLQGLSEKTSAGSPPITRAIRFRVAGMPFAWSGTERHLLRCKRPTWQKQHPDTPEAEPKDKRA